MPIKLMLYALMTGVLLLNTAQVAALTIVSWGGAYEYSQNQAYFQPFSAKTGISIQIERYNGNIERLQQHLAEGTPAWDVIDMEASDNRAACSQGLLEPLDHSQLAAAPDGTPVSEDFIPDGLLPCGVAQIISATVMAYNRSAFPGIKPTRAADLFDLERFPGKRALQRSPQANLEWALLSYGIPVQDVYNLLSTKRGLALAFERLDQIKNEIIWWTEGSEPPALLATGKVTIASGFNGRFFHATVVEGQPIEIIWHGQLYDYSTWGIVRGSQNIAQAMQFIRFATATEQLAKQTEYIAYGPARYSSYPLVWKHAASGIDIRPHLPTYPPNMSHAIRKDHIWYANTKARLNQAFKDWLKR